MLAVLLVSLPLVTACSPEVGRAVPAAEPPRESSAVLLFDFDIGAAAPGHVLSSADNSGTERVEVAVATAAGGRVRRDRARTGFAIRRPAITVESRSPAAALVVWPARGDSELTPGPNGFRFGADFRLDAVSEDSSDNGDNLVQRGLFGSAQYKLQLDHGIVSCRVAGAEGAVVVKTDPPVERNLWYRVSCERSADRVIVTLAVARDKAGWAPARMWMGGGAIGDLDIEDEVPLSIGAKVSDEGQIVTSAPDQFNGLVDRVFFEQVS